MAKLNCSMCNTQKDEKDFTTFSRNPKFKDRNGNCPICKECCSNFVVERGNTKDALKEVLRLQDIPYLENYADSAFESYNKKIKNTNLVIKKNVHDSTEEVKGIETTNHQNTIYTNYSSKLGLMPKKYIDFSYSDGIRDNVVEEKKEEVKDDSGVDMKLVHSAVKYLTKLFTTDVYNNKEIFPRAVEIKFQELSLHKNNTNARQNKFKLKNHISVLIEAKFLKKEDFSFMFGDDEDAKPTDLMVVDIKDENVATSELPDGMDIETLKARWGDDFKIYELVKYEKKYIELKKNYEIKTTAHDEFLRHACVASVKANECMARNDVDGAKQWFAIFKDMTSAGKLQPNQMSKADLSGGLNNFSEFFRTVEQSRRVIDILPEMYETPRDKADLVIFCLVQYVRRLKGLPDIEYSETYKFYEEMESQFIDDSDGDIDLGSFFENESESGESE